MKEHKIFKPEILIQDHIKSSWCQNIRTIKDKIPINAFLKEKGIFALDINPNPRKELYMFGLPVNKNWGPEKFDNNSSLCFEIYSEENISINLIFQDSKNNNSEPTKIIIDNNSVNSWKKFNIPVLMPNNVRLILFAGSSLNTPNYVIRNITIETQCDNRN